MKKLIHQFSKFVIVGFTNTALDFFSYLALTRLFAFCFNHPVFSAMVSFFIANLNSYLLNKYWTFSNKNKQHHVQYSKFLIVSLIGLGLNLLIFGSLVHLQVYDLIAKLIPVPIVMLWNFIANKIWTFKDTKSGVDKISSF
ncbi:MAG: GtrA family protein [Patescibacteria group bacterium]